MSEETKNLPTTPAKNKKLVLEVRKSLNKAKFSPVSILVNQVFPVLEPKEQARVCLELISYLFPKPTVVAKAPKATRVNVNTQINTNQQPGFKDPNKVSVNELLRIASQKLE